MPKLMLRKLAAIMFTDIVGYTALMQADESNAAVVRARHRQVFQQQHETYGGEIIQYFGDGTLSIFKSGVKAIECAIAIQKAMQQGQAIPLRIGLHMSDIVFEEDDIYGDGVNIASRIENLAIAGSILLSGTLNAELRNQPHITTQSLGFFDLKNIEQSIEVFAVSDPAINVPKRSQLKDIAPSPSKTIAVLPFVNMSADAANEFFSDGITEEIINALSKIKGLKVTSRTSSFFFKNQQIPITQIGQQLNVATILEGSVRLAGNQMRITAQLIDVADDYHFWSETFDRSIDDLFAVQDEVSMLIADKLREHIGHFELDEHLVETHEVPIEIYQSYLKSRYLILKMGKSSIEEGLSILKDNIQSAPDFPLAYLGVHLGYSLLGTIGLMPVHEAFAKAQPYLAKAIELNENLAECQLHLSYKCFLQEWDIAGTYRHLQKSFEIRPTVEYYQSMASTLVVEAKFTAAMNYIDIALQLDPFSGINYHLKGFIYYVQQNYEAALQWFEKSVNLKSNFIVSTLYYGQTLLLDGRGEEALTFFQNLPQNEAKDLVKLGGTTLAYAAIGDTIQAKAGIADLKLALQSDAMDRALNLLILCHALLDEREATLELIEQGISYRLPMMVYLAVEPILLPLRNEARFKDLMQQVIGKQTDTLTPAKPKYKKSLLNKKQIEQYRQQLEHLMAEQQPYLSPNLTLRDLAALHGCSCQPPLSIAQ